MANLPDDEYKFISSMMHPSPADQWSPVVHRKLGSGINLYQLTEGVYDMGADFPFTQDDQNRIREHLDEEGRLPSMRFGMCVVRLPNGTNILLDAGLGPWMPEIRKCSCHPVPEEPPHPLSVLLERINLSFDDVHFVVYSHCHGDHVGWTASFPNAIHCLHRREYEFATYVGCPWRNDAAKRFEPLEKAGKLRTFTGEKTVLDEAKAPEVSLVLVDGHTPGHVCVEINDGTESAMYVGDAMHFILQVERPELVPLFDCCAWKVRSFLPFGGDNVETTWMPSMLQKPNSWNDSTSARSRRKLLKLISDNKSLLISPHFSHPGMGYVTEDADGKFAFSKAKEA